MEFLLEELTGGFPSLEQMARVTIRVVAAAVLGAVVGIQRERWGKSAGARTHMLVSMGTALFVLVPLEADFAPADTSRVIQGIAAGIGFLGAGAILKRSQEQEITGLTTAAGIWTTAAVGVAVGLGRVGTAVIGTGLAWIILAIVGRLEHRGPAGPAAP